MVASDFKLAVVAEPYWELQILRDCIKYQWVLATAHLNIQSLPDAHGVRE